MTTDRHAPVYPDRDVVIVGVDGTPTATTAALWAADEAVRRRTSLQLVQAFTVPSYYAGPGLYVPMDLADEMRAWCASSVAGTERAVAAAFPGLATSTSVIEEQPWVALQQASEKADLLVVGSRASAEIGATVSGSLPLRLAAHAHCPVAVVKTDDAGHRRDAAGGVVLVCVDGVVDPDDLLELAFREAQLRAVDLVALHLWDDDFPPGFAWRYSPEDESRRETQELRLLQDRVDPWSAKFPGTPERCRVGAGHPRRDILRWIERAEPQDRPALVVVGSRGLGAVSGLLLGSTSHALIARSPVPVIVVGFHPGRRELD